MTEELLSEIERANHVRALERELARVQAHAIKTASELTAVLSLRGFGHCACKPA